MERVYRQGRKRGGRKAAWILAVVFISLAAVLFSWADPADPIGFTGSGMDSGRGEDYPGGY